MKLWLDDRRREPPGWTRALSVTEAQAYLATGLVEEASLDQRMREIIDRKFGGVAVQE